MNILLIEDEVKLAKAIKYLFKDENINCEIENDGQDGFYNASNNEYDCIVLDIMLPSMNGYEILSELRKANNNTPVIMLTAKGEIEDKVKGLNLGADDYLTKPFDPSELIARVNALVRRSSNSNSLTIKFSDLELDTASAELSCNSESIKLNFKELELMKLLIKKSNVILERSDIFYRVWGLDCDATENTVEAYISFLRRKLKFLKSKCIIKNYSKIGYRLEENND